MYCNNCGQNVPDNSAACPNCGAALTGDNSQNVNTNPNPYGTNVNINVPQYAQQQKTNGLCIAGFVISLVGFLCCGGIVSIVGLILSVVGVNKVKQTGEGGKGLGVAGIVLGAIGIVWLIIALVTGVFAGLTESFQ